MWRALTLLLALLLLVYLPCPASAFTAEENARIEAIENAIARLENLLYSVFGRMDNLYAELSSLRNLLRSLENRITAPSGLKVFLGVVENGSLSLRSVEENVWVRPGLLLVVVKYDNGDPASGRVELYPPLTENALLSLFTGGLPKLEGALSSGVCVIAIPQIEGQWTGRVLDTGLPVFSFGFRVGPPPQPGPQQAPRVYITTEGAFARGKPCVIKAVSTAGEMPQGTIRVVDPVNPAGSAEGPNPLSYVPRSKSVTVYFMQGDNVVAYASLSEPEAPKEGGIGWWKVAVLVWAAALAAYLLFLRRRRVPIPR